MNQQSIRNELIEEYIRHLEGEFLREYSPARISSIKEKETDKLWREIFTNSYNKCDSDVLKQKTKKLLLRLEVIGSGNTPPFFGNMLIDLIRHPKLDPISREVTFTLRRASSRPSKQTEPTLTLTPRIS